MPLQYYLNGGANVATVLVRRVFLWLDSARKGPKFFAKKSFLFFVINITTHCFFVFNHTLNVVVGSMTCNRCSVRCTVEDFSFGKKSEQILQKKSVKKQKQ
jgi:hypothetical protein